MLKIGKSFLKYLSYILSKIRTNVYLFISLVQRKSHLSS